MPLRLPVFHPHLPQGSGNLNWNELPKPVKLALVFSALLGAHAGAIWYERRALARGGIWLMAQIYHLDEHYPTALLQP